MGDSFENGENVIGRGVWFFVLFSALMGCWPAPIFLFIVSARLFTLFITAGTFGAMSVYGYFTKTDLSKMAPI